MLFTIVFSAVVATSLATKSFLNQALSAAVDELNESGFLDQQYQQWYASQPYPVPPCEAKTRFPKASSVPASSDLGRVLSTGEVRIGYSALATANPVMFINAAGEFTGIEFEEAKKSVEILAREYNTPLTAKFVSVSGVGGYFPPLADALNQKAVDMVWTRMTNTPARELEVDFTTCNSFATAFTLAAASGVSLTNFVAGNTVGCIEGSIFCTLPIPEGLQQVVLSGVTLDGAYAQLASGQVDYLINAVEQHASFIASSNCAGCTFSTTPLTGQVVWAPATRQLTQEEIDELDSSESSSSSSSSTE